MPIVAFIFIIVATAVVLLTLRVAYVTRNVQLRKRLLRAHKAKHGDYAFDMYSRIYTRQFVIALSLVSLWQVLYVASNIYNMMRGRETILSLIVGGVGLLAGLFGFYLASIALKRK